MLMPKRRILQNLFEIIVCCLNLCANQTESELSVMTSSKYKVV